MPGNGGIFFPVGSSTTLDAGTVFAGSILAHQNITLVTFADLLCDRATAPNAA